MNENELNEKIVELDNQIMIMENNNEDLFNIDIIKENQKAVMNELKILSLEKQMQNHFKLISDLKQKLAQANNNLDRYEDLLEEMETYLKMVKREDGYASRVENAYFVYCDYLEGQKIEPKDFKIWYIQDYLYSLRIRVEC